MRERILQIIDYKTNGRQAEFARLMGWSKQYIGRLVTVGGIGINPIIAILKKIPEIDARWLILGEGTMLRCDDMLRRRLLEMLQLEKYIPVMSPEELRRFTDGDLSFTKDETAAWEASIQRKQDMMDARFRKAYERQKKLVEGEKPATSLQE
ncbi:MAG: hypothetical protein ACI30I_04175 [Parabacteroides sp.]